MFHTSTRKPATSPASWYRAERVRVRVRLRVRVRVRRTGWSVVKVTYGLVDKWPE